MRPRGWDSVGRQLVSRFPCSAVGAAPGLVCDEEGSWQEPRGLSRSQIRISSLRLNRWRKKSLAVTPRTDVRPGLCRADGRWHLAAGGECFGCGSVCVCGRLYFLAAAPCGKRLAWLRSVANGGGGGGGGVGFGRHLKRHETLTWLRRGPAATQQQQQQLTSSSLIFLSTIN